MGLFSLFNIFNWGKKTKPVKPKPRPKPKICKDFGIIDAKGYKVTEKEYQNAISRSTASQQANNSFSAPTQPSVEDVAKMAFDTGSEVYINQERTGSYKVELGPTHVSHDFTGGGGSFGGGGSSGSYDSPSSSSSSSYDSGGSCDSGSSSGGCD